ELLSSYNGTPTDPLNADTDGDGLRDGDEDLNQDGSLTSGETNPTIADTDMDGIDDGIELGISGSGTLPTSPPIITDPLNPDTDGDGLIDGFEDANGDGVHDSLLNETRADRPDTDYDRLDDNEEPTYSTDPNDRDSDNDWLPDGWEVLTFGTNATLFDTDGEGLHDGLELFRFRTNPLLPDTDFDGLTDWEEVRVYRTNPRSNDTDHDGLYDNEEISTYGTDPKNPDTDRDGVSDYDEVMAGTNPLNAPPFARFGLDRQVYRNEDVQLDGTQSFDVDGTVESYFWNFVGPISLTITNPWDPMIRFSQLGEYNVTLTVTDDDGESGTSTVTFTVVNQPPIADAGLDQSVFSGFSVDFQATPGSSDPDGSIVTYVWDFMDGTFGFGPSTTHVFGLPGTYYVTLTVVDNDGGRDTDTVVITAEEPRPPDLVIPSEDIDFVTDGTDVILSLTIHNDGDLDADSLSFELSDDATGWTALWSEASGIPAGSSLDFDIVLPPEPIGSHNIRIEVDQDQEVDESDEGNNVVYISVPDADEDSLSDLGESIIGTNPNDSDSDGDGLKDGPHSVWSPSDWVTEQDAFVDTDGDGLINALDSDSDNDGYSDGVDIDPLHDLLVKLQIDQLDIRDNIDFDIVRQYRLRHSLETLHSKNPLRHLHLEV
ncbi:MAG: PKD domain-containing protein, partial [Candidatus Thorarchaeota archaeon]